MSVDIFYKDIPMNWRDIAVHTEANIHGFFGEFLFLSNFYSCVTAAGYPSVENGYMAAKVKAEYRPLFKTMTAADAKKTWRKYPLVDDSAADWDARKFAVMDELLRQKFDPKLNPELHAKLMATGRKELVEKNWWGDRVWGVDLCGVGQNALGYNLMKIRSEFTQNIEIRLT